MMNLGATHAARDFEVVNTHPNAPAKPDKGLLQLLLSATFSDIN